MQTKVTLIRTHKYVALLTSIINAFHDEPILDANTLNEPIHERTNPTFTQAITSVVFRAAPRSSCRLELYMGGGHRVTRVSAVIEMPLAFICTQVAGRASQPDQTAAISARNLWITMPSSNVNLV